MENITINQQYIDDYLLPDATYCVNTTLLEDNGELRNITMAPESYRMTTSYAHQRFCYISNNDHGLKDIAFPILNKKDLVIDGKGANLNCVGRILPIFLSNCENVTIKNFVIDYERPMFTQGEVVAIDDESVTLAIDKKEFPYYIVNHIIYFIGVDYSENFIQCFLEFDKSTKRPLKDARDVMGWTPLPVEEISEGVVRFFFDFSGKDPVPVPEGVLKANKNSFPPHRLRVGTTVVMKHERRLLPSIVIDHCKNIFLENIWIKHSNTMGVLAQFSENISLDYIKVATDPKSPRVVSANADALHFVGCKGLITCDHCFIESQLDDVINVHGNYLKVVHALGERRVIAQIPHHQQVGACGVEAGTHIRVCDGNTMLPVGELVVEKIHRINHSYYDITFVQTFDFVNALPCCLEDLDGRAEFIFRNSNCGRNRARGISVTTGKNILIEDNILDSEGAPINIGSDMHNWFESGAIGHIVIRNNELHRRNMKTWGKALIDLAPQMKTMPKGEYMHNELYIENNKIYLEERAVFNGRSFKKLQIKNNEIHITKGSEFSDETIANIENYGEAIIENKYVFD